MGVIEKDIAIIVEAPVQFFSIKNTIDELSKRNRTIDIIVPYLEEYTVVTSAASKILEDNSCNFITTNDIDNRKYKVCLAPYPVASYAEIDAKYRIRYGYSILTAKPDPTYSPSKKVWFDAIICHGPQEAEMMEAYTRTYNISPMKYDGFRKKAHKGKPILLYLPTSGNVSSASQTKEIITALKDDFRVIVRMHAHIAHGQNEEEKSRNDLIKRLADEVCDDMTPLTDWLQTADVVLSDNSGSIYESIYSQTPVAVFAEDVRSRKFGNILPLHSELIDEGVIPYTNKIDELRNTVKKALSLSVRDAQGRARENYFNIEGNGVNRMMDIIDSHLNDSVNQQRWWLHQKLASEYHTNRNRLRDLNNAYKKSVEKNKNLERQLAYYKQAKGHRFMSSIYKVYRRIRG